MKKYYYHNFLNVAIKIYIGEFKTERECWEFFHKNKKEIEIEQQKLTPDDKLWVMRCSNV